MFAPHEVITHQIWGGLMTFDFNATKESQKSETPRIPTIPAQWDPWVASWAKPSKYKKLLILGGQKLEYQENSKRFNQELGKWDDLNLLQCKRVLGHVPTIDIQVASAKQWCKTSPVTEVQAKEEGLCYSDDLHWTSTPDTKGVKSFEASQVSGHSRWGLGICSMQFLLPCDQPLPNLGSARSDTEQGRSPPPGTGHHYHLPSVPPCIVRSAGADHTQRSS